MRGQASLEYVAALALLVLLLAGAGAAVAAPDLPGAVVHQMRVALCIVGGDICRASDAERRGLEPCVVAGEDHERETGVTALSLRTGDGQRWTLLRRSDGSFQLSAGSGTTLGVEGGAEVALGPVQAGATGTAAVTFRSGLVWDLADQAALDRMLDRIQGFDLANVFELLHAGFPTPTAAYQEGGGGLGGELTLKAAEELSGGADTRAIIGRRRAADSTTFYLDLGANSASSLADLVPGLDRHARVLAEYRTGASPSLTLRTTTRGRGDEETETEMRLPLEDPADAAAARRLAFLNLDDPTFALRDVLARAREHGTVQRLRYVTKRDDGDWAYGAALGVKLGLDHSESVLRRQLVDARVLDGGPTPARRADCLGVD